METKSEITTYLPFANTAALVIAVIYFHRSSVDQKNKIAELENKLEKINTKLKAYAKYSTQKMKNLEQSAVIKSVGDHSLNGTPSIQEGSFQESELFDSLGLAS